jgi:hypothetical protein
MLAHSVTAGFSVEPSEPKGHRPVRPFGVFVVQLTRGGASGTAARSAAALPRAIRCQAYSLKSRVLVERNAEGRARNPTNEFHLTVFRLARSRSPKPQALAQAR